MCWECVSLHQQNPAVQCHFDILQQLKSVTLDSKTSLREASLYLVGGGADNCRDGKMKVAGI